MADTEPEVGEGTLILPKSESQDGQENKAEAKEQKKKTKLIQHNRRMSITASTTKTKKDTEEMKQQIVTFLFESADSDAVMTIYKAAKKEKRRIMELKDKEFAEAEKERKKQEAAKAKAEKEKEKQEARAAKQAEKEKAKEEARAAKQAEKEKREKEKEEQRKAKEEAAKEAAKLKKEGSKTGLRSMGSFLRKKADSNVIFEQGFVLVKHTEIVETENPLHGKEDATVVQTADGTKIDHRLKTIQTVAVKWKRSYFILDSDGLTEYEEEVKDTNNLPEDKLGEYEFKLDTEIDGQNDQEFKVKSTTEELALRFMTKDECDNWKKAFAKHFKALKKMKKLKSPSKKDSSPSPIEEEGDKEKEEEDNGDGEEQEKAEPEKQEAEAEAEAEKPAEAEK